MTDNRFSLRPLELQDSVRMLEWMRDPEITKYLQIGGPDTSKDSVDEFILNAGDESTNLHRAVVDSTGEYMGTISLKHIDYEKKEAEYAIAMRSSALGTGAAVTASRLLLELAFRQLGLQRVYLNVLQANQRAVRFYEKFGFRYTHESTLQVHGVEMALKWYEIQTQNFQ